MNRSQRLALVVVALLPLSLFAGCDEGGEPPADAGTDSATELYWDRSAPAWRSGAWVTLLDPSGAVQATYQIP